MITAAEARKMHEDRVVKENDSILVACNSVIKQAITEGNRSCKFFNIGNATCRVWLLDHLVLLGYSATCVYPSDQRDSTYIEISW